MTTLYLFLGFLLAFWIYLIYSLIVVRKKKTDIAERRYKMLKTFLLVAIISFPVFAFSFVAAIAHPSGIIGLVYSIMAPLSGGAFFIAAIVGLVIFFKGRQKELKGIPK